jgi:hypothetical protein
MPDGYIDCYGAHINWPTHLYSYGAHGMYVYLVVPDIENFHNCYCGTCVLPYVGELVEPETDGQKTPLLDTWWPHIHKENMDSVGQYESASLLACLCLGSSAGTWTSKKDGEEDKEVEPPLKCNSVGQWYCTYSDLTPRGRAIYNSLEKLYGIEPTLLTFVDT